MVYFVLFCVIAFAAVPLALRAFLVMQTKAGNGEIAVIKWQQAHEQSVVFGFWCLFIVGLVIAFTLARNEILNLLK